MNNYQRVSLGDLLTLERRPVILESDKQYSEIGIYSFGRGIFHKTPRSALEVGDKELYLIKDGDFILQITFAWEGAVALASSVEDGMFGSVRFPTFRVDEALCFPLYLVNYFRTEAGRQQLVNISPGSAGRNRVLSLKRIPEVLISLPPLDEQRRIVARIEELAAKIEEARGLRRQSVEEGNSLYHVSRNFIYSGLECERYKIGNLLNLVNGRAFKPSDWTTSGRKIIRIQNLKYADAPYNYFDGPVEDKFLLEKGDVLFAWSGQVVSLGAHIWNGEEAILNQHIFNVKPKQPMLPRFLQEGLNALVEEMKTQVRGLEMFHIRKEELNKLLFPVPSLEEQQHIVDYLDDLQAKVDGLKRHQAETSAELDALLPSILDKAFKGEL